MYQQRLRLDVAWCRQVPGDIGSQPGSQMILNGTNFRRIEREAEPVTAFPMSQRARGDDPTNAGYVTDATL